MPRPSPGTESIAHRSPAEETDRSDRRFDGLSGARAFLGGSLSVLVSDALLLPIGLVLTVFLTRVLGPSDYGLFVLVSAVVFWIERAIVSLFRRPGLRLLVDSAEPGAVGALVSWQVLTGAGCAALLVLGADAAARLLGDPDLAPLLRLFALDVPFYCAARGYRTAMVSRLRYGERAQSSAVGLVLRLALVLSLVSAGFGVTGAIGGFLGASVAETLYGVRRVGLPRMLPRPSWLAGFWRQAGPLAAAAVAVGLYQNLDLLLLGPLGTESEAIGSYGAAHRSSRALLVVSSATSPLLLAAVRDLWRQDRKREAATRIEQVFAGLFLLLPFVGLGVAGAPELVRLVFGPEYAPSAGPLALLLTATYAQIVLSLGIAAAVGIGRTSSAVWICVLLPGLAAIGHSLAIPRFHLVGASAVSATVGLLGAVGISALLRARAGARLPRAALLRGVGIGALGAFLVRAEVGSSSVFLVRFLVALSVVTLLVVLSERLRPSALRFSETDR